MVRLMTLFVLALAACGSPGSAAPAAGPNEAQGALAAAPVAKIVFVDKERCCDCTQKKVDAGWGVLEEALVGREIPVERLHLDTQGDAVEPWRQKRPFVAVPALYLVAPDGAVVALFQGEWTREQLIGALEGGRG